MSNIATTISQSRKLVELGLDPSTADMYYPYLIAGIYCDTPRIGFPIEYSGGRDVPAWSLTGLLEVIPKNLLPTLEWRDGENEWEVNVWVDHNIHSISHYDKLIAAYGMLCWLLEQGLIEKGGQQ